MDNKFVRCYGKLFIKKENFINAIQSVKSQVPNTSDIDPSDLVNAFAFFGARADINSSGDIEDVELLDFSKFGMFARFKDVIGFYIEDGSYFIYAEENGSEKRQYYKDHWAFNGTEEAPELDDEEYSWRCKGHLFIDTEEFSNVIDAIHSWTASKDWQIPWNDDESIEEIFEHLGFELLFDFEGNINEAKGCSMQTDFDSNDYFIGDLFKAIAPFVQYGTVISWSLAGAGWTHKWEFDNKQVIDNA